MKTFRYILINKNNMTAVQHAATASAAADIVYGNNTSKNYGFHWIIVKDENRVVDMVNFSLQGLGKYWNFIKFLENA